MGSDKILLVFEGEVAEKAYFNSFKRAYSLEDNVFFAVYGAEIYQLWKEIEEDEYLDLLELLKERNTNPELENLCREEISQIFLFFDHEAHSHPELLSKDYYKGLDEMLSTFDNETENGKMYFSYPMIEAIKDCKRDYNECFECTTYICHNTSYKKDVAARSDFNNINRLTQDDWNYLFLVNMTKAYVITNNSFKTPSYKEASSITQKDILKCQYNKYIKTNSSTASLSALPFYMLDLFPKTKYDNIIKKISFEKNCSFLCI